jgi:hypothetical protein
VGVSAGLGYGGDADGTTYRKSWTPSGKLIPDVKGVPPRSLEMSHSANLLPNTPPILQ